MRKTKKSIVLILSVFVLISWASAQVPKPEDILGFKVGTDRKLADMHQIVEYFQKLDQASPRVLLQEVGKTTEGNPFITAIITSEKNHKNLEKYRRIQQMLADPRKVSGPEAERMIAEGKAIVMVNCSLHASEVGAAQMSMELAYDLATRGDEKTQRILDNVILLLTPMHNPDGTQMVVDWYRKNLGTKYEGGRMPWLYQKYTGHDNNRDWYMFTQVESRLTLKVHNAWHPMVIVDMHQMGSNGARLFVPPYVDPYEPNVDPILRQEVAMMGTYIATELTSQGKGGVEHSSGFDAWTPARAYHHYHGGIRILTEAASVKLATPIEVPFDALQPSAQEESVRMPLPWKGGAWTLRDIVDYDYAAVAAALTNASGLRGSWVRNFYNIHKKAVDPGRRPYAYVIPADQRDLPAALRMLEVFRLGDVEVHRAESGFNADGHSYPAGTFIVYMAQPFGGFAKTLLERQKYPEIREYPGAPLKTPYDVVGHTLPLLMGVDVMKVEASFKVNARPLDTIVIPNGRLAKETGGFGYVWGHETNDDIAALNRLLGKGYRVYWNAEKFQANGTTYPVGRMIVQKKEGLEADLRTIAGDLPVTFQPLPEKPKVRVFALKAPRLALYKSWTASMDEGWTRWVLEKFEFPYQSVVDKDIRKGNLHKDFDVILIPDMSDAAIVEGLSEEDVPPEYAGGIGDVGVKNLEDFMNRGGAVITLNSAAEFAIQRFHLGIENTVKSLDRKEFFIPGSILKVLNDTNHPIAYGFKRDASIFFRRSPVFAVNEGTSVAQYPTASLLSGWAGGAERLVNRSALVDVPIDKGRVILIGFPTQYRAQTHLSFRYLFNAIFYGAASPDRF